jgi:short-subunit dehydrogenase
MIKGVLMKKRLLGKTVVLSGASSGIGRRLAKILICDYGANVIGLGRNEEKMRSLKQELGENADKFAYRIFDVSIQENWTDFANYLHQSGVKIHLLINNAGAFPTFAKGLNTPPETLERIMRTNFFSAVYAIQALKDMLFENQDGGVVNICSSAALCTVAGTSAYSASKAAMKAYTESLMLEEKGKYVGIVYPGTTKTELFRDDEKTQNSALDKVAMSPEKMARKITKCIVKRRKRAIVGWDAKLMNFVAKIAPVRGLSMIAGVMKWSKSKVFNGVFDD